MPEYLQYQPQYLKYKGALCSFEKELFYHTLITINKLNKQLVHI